MGWKSGSREIQWHGPRYSDESVAKAGQGKRTLKPPRSFLVACVMKHVRLCGGRGYAVGQTAIAVASNLMLDSTSSDRSSGVSVDAHPCWHIDKFEDRSIHRTPVRVFLIR